jgi:hypothetical protein
MKQTSRKLLRGLCEKNTKASLLAFVLQEEKKLSTTEAQRLLVQALVARDHEEDSIPNPDGKSLEEWLEELLLHIPCSEVMDAAQIVRPNQ